MTFAASLILALSLAGASPAAIAQAAPPSACSLLTKELALKVSSAANKKVFDMLPPSEEKIPGGTSCDYGDIRIQIGAKRTPETIAKLGPEWTTVPNLGDGAWYRPNRTRYAELTVHVGARRLDIQMGVPTGGTPDQIKPKAIELANALIPKLK